MRPYLYQLLESVMAAEKPAPVQVIKRASLASAPELQPVRVVPAVGDKQGVEIPIGWSKDEYPLYTTKKVKSDGTPHIQPSKGDSIFGLGCLPY